jgi:peptidylprolyl isomerase
MPNARLLLTALLACVALALAACGGDDEKDTAGDAPAETTAQAPAPISKDLEEKPSIQSPGGDPPAELQKEDIVVGKGRTAKAGDNVSVQYAGVSWSNGAEFDASWNRGGQPFEFTLGAGNVIAGWDEGVVGMKEGGRRKLVIPPDQAYGPAGQPPSIGPNETLIFVVDLEKVTR